MTPADQQTREILREAVPDLVAVYRFGSTDSGTAGPESDVDLAVLARTRLDANARFELQDRLAEVFRHPVDLVDLRAASTVMAMQVVGAGTVLYEGDPAERGRFEDLTFSLYARLNEERRGILDRVAHEGTVYGR
jgi:predicted nucleotidyltransferase